MLIIIFSLIIVSFVDILLMVINDIFHYFLLIADLASIILSSIFIFLILKGINTHNCKLALPTFIVFFGNFALRGYGLGEIFDIIKEKNKDIDYKIILIPLFLNQALLMFLISFSYPTNRSRN